MINCCLWSKIGLWGSFFGVLFWGPFFRVLFWGPLISRCRAAKIAAAAFLFWGRGFFSLRVAVTPAAPARIILEQAIQRKRATLTDCPNNETTSNNLIHATLHTLISETEQLPIFILGYPLLKRWHVLSIEQYCCLFMLQGDHYLFIGSISYHLDEILQQ